MRESGGRAVTLESQVRRFPGGIDVYQVNANERWPEYDRTRSTYFMRRLAGCGFGFGGGVSGGDAHWTGIRWGSGK